ncbi:MAG: sugar kinase [Clostridiales bacterium]|nr:sugar kinase [Clostridiales bacterium]
MKFDVTSLGEIICRLSPPGNERLSRCEELKRQIGGAELNVVSALSNMGLRSAIITKIPNNRLGVFVKNSIRSFGVSDDLLIYDNSSNARLGLYYSESGAAPRKPCVIYDREHSSFCSLTLEDINPEIYSASKIFHTTGITLALAPEIRENTIEIIKEFSKTKKTLISFDVNFRANLWNEDEARKTITEILPYVDIFFCSQETAKLTFGKTGNVEQILKSFADEYNIKIVASTKRDAITPKVHSFTSYIYDSTNKAFYTEKPYENIDVIDRIGSGDAYIAGVLYGLLTHDFDCMKALQYGNAFSVLKNTIPGDILCSDISEINSIISAHNGGHTSEMDR